MSMPRVASVTSLLKRFFSRDDTRNEPRSDANVEASEMNTLISNEEKLKKLGNSSKRITADVIEEVSQYCLKNKASDLDCKPNQVYFFTNPKNIKSKNIQLSAGRTFSSHSVHSFAYVVILIGSKFGFCRWMSRLP